MEVCSSLQSLAGFARGEGIWSGLPVADRCDQIDRMMRTLDELYPTLRWFLFDGLRSYSAPMTIFGPLRVAIYVGDMYLVFNSTEHVRELTRLFDALIRAAVTQPPDVARRIEELAREI